MLRAPTRKALCTCVLFALFAATTSSAQEPAPTPAIYSPFAIVAIQPADQTSQVVQLTRVEKQLGGPDRSFVDGTISFDRATAYSLLAPQPQARITPLLRHDAKLYVVKFDFTLNRLQGERRCRRMTLRLVVDDPEAEIVSLFPRRINVTDQAPKTLTVNEVALLSAAEGLTGPFPVEGLEPTISGTIKEGRILEWTFYAPASSSLSPGAKSVYFVVRVPDSREKTPLSAAWAADVGSYSFGRWWWPEPATSETVKRAVSLR